MDSQLKQVYEFNSFRLDEEERLLFRDGEVVALPPKSFDLLVALVKSGGRVITKEELMSAVWPDSFVEEANLSHHVFTLRKTLGEEKNGNKYIETMPRRGYRFVVPVTEVRDDVNEIVIAERLRSRVIIEQEVTDDGSTGASHLPDESLAALPPAGRKPFVSLLALTFLGIAVLAIAGYFWKSGTRNPPSAPGLKSIAVLPFKPLAADRRNEALELGMADSLIAKLSGIRQLVVRPVSAVRNYMALDQDPIAAGRALGVDYVIEGNLQLEGETVRATVRLLRVEDGTAIWTDRCDQACSSLFALQDGLAQQVVSKLGHELSGGERQRLAKHYTENSEAYRLYVQGRYFWNKRSEEGFRKGIEYFTQALQIDPNYALAHSGLADCYALLANSSRLAPQDGFPKAKAAALRALEIDDALAEAHTSLAFVYYQFDIDFEAAEREFERAIELNPNYATAHQWYGDFLVWVGRKEEALREAQLAQQNDPLSLVINAELADYYRQVGQTETALAQLRKTLEMDPDFIRTHQSFGRVYLQTGEYEKAIAEYRRARQIDESPRTIAFLGFAYAVAGKKSEAHQIIAELQALSGHQFVSAKSLAMIYVALGENDRAFAWVDKAYERREDMSFLTRDEDLQPLREDPRYGERLRRFGLSP